MLRALSRIWKQRVLRKHDWLPAEEFRRTCASCGRVSYVMQNRFPQIGEPSLSWSEVGPCEKERTST